MCTCVSRGCSGDEEGFNKHFPITSHMQGHLWGSGGCTGGCGVQALFSRGRASRCAWLLTMRKAGSGRDAGEDREAPQRCTHVK